MDCKRLICRGGVDATYCHQLGYWYHAGRKAGSIFHCFYVLGFPFGLWGSCLSYSCLRQPSTCWSGFSSLLLSSRIASSKAILALCLNTTTLCKNMSYQSRFLCTVNLLSFSQSTFKPPRMKGFRRKAILHLDSTHFEFSLMLWLTSISYSNQRQTFYYFIFQSLTHYLLLLEDCIP